MIRQADSGPSAFHGHYGASRQFRVVLSDGTSAHRSLLKITKIDKPDDSGMGGAECDGEFAEILVKRYQHLAVLRRMPKNLFVARVSTPVADPLDFVPGPLQLIPCAGPDAAIEQELQAASSVMAGSMRS